MEPTWLRIARTYIGEKGGTNGCALFVGKCLEASGLPPTLSIKARSYLGYGTQLRRPKKGCLVILWRKEPECDLGHIGFFLNYTPDKRINMLSSHFGLVSIKTFPKTNLLGYRWPHVSFSTKSRCSTKSS